MTIDVRSIYRNRTSLNVEYFTCNKLKDIGIFYMYIYGLAYMNKLGNRFVQCDPGSAFSNKWHIVPPDQGRTELSGCLELARWAGLSGVQVGRHVKCCSRINHLGQRERGEKGARDKITKRRRGKDGVEWEGPLDREAGLYLDICAPPPPSASLVTPLLMGPVCLPT